MNEIIGSGFWDGVFWGMMIVARVTGAIAWLLFSKAQKGGCNEE